MEKYVYHMVQLLMVKILSQLYKIAKLSLILNNPNNILYKIKQGSKELV